MINDGKRLNNKSWNENELKDGDWPRIYMHFKYCAMALSKSQLDYGMDINPNISLYTEPRIFCWYAFVLKINYQSYLNNQLMDW